MLSAKYRNEEKSNMIVVEYLKECNPPKKEIFEQTYWQAE